MPETVVDATAGAVPDTAKAFRLYVVGVSKRRPEQEHVDIQVRIVSPTDDAIQITEFGFPEEESNADFWADQIGNYTDPIIVTFSESTF